VEWEVVLLLALVGAPLTAALTSVWPSRATRWAGRVCLMMVGAVIVIIGSLWWDAMSRRSPLQHGDDSAVVLSMSAVLLVGAINLVGWAVAHARAPRPGPLG
jgi:hypothetical protein